MLDPAVHVEQFTNNYARAHTLYDAAGWPNVLPLPPGAKMPPPVGYTGAGGRTPSAADVLDWKLWQPADGNVALRLPPGVIGLDIDQYGDKTGHDNLLDAVRDNRLTPMRPTWRTSARPGASGIYLYRVPPETKLRGIYVPSVETIQNHHRFALVWPSIHPSGLAYLWRTSAGVMPGVPRIDELSWMAPDWIDYGADTLPEALPAAHPAPGEHRANVHDWGPAVQASYDAAVNALRDAHSGSRHDVALARTMRLCRLEQYGATGATTALETFGALFVSLVAPDRGDTEADAEWRRMLDGGRTLARTTITVADRAAQEERDTLAELLPDAVDGEAAPFDLGSWNPVNLSEILRNGFHRPEPTLMRYRDHPGALFYPRQVNALYGRDGSGKTWALLAAAAQEIKTGHNVMLMDVEANAEQIAARLRALDCTDDEIIAHVTYLHPDEPADPAIARVIAEMVGDLGITLVGIDSVGEMYSIHGINEDRDNEVAPWNTMLPRRIADAGPGVVLIDHPPHNADDALRPSGSKRKRAAITGAAYTVTADPAPTAQTSGKLRIRCAKDRHGTYQRGRQIAVVLIEPRVDGRTDISMHPVDDEGASQAAFALVTRALVRTIGNEGPMNTTAILNHPACAARDETKRAALDHAVSAGYLRVEPAPRGAKTYTHMRDCPADVAEKDQQI